MANLFETEARMPADPSKEVVRAALAEPQDNCMADVPGLCKYDRHIAHAPIPRAGAK